MKPLNNIQAIKTFYFVGIGGIGMSALARYFKQKNKVVLGYDRTASTLTQKLEAEGIKIHFNEQTALSELEKLDKSSSAIVYTPAISQQSMLWKFMEVKDFFVIKRAALLGKLTQNKFCLAVAGTHGKTTTTCILTHILKENGIGVTAFLGGILSQEQTNYISTGEDVFVVEADEFDRSFLQLNPTAAVITSTDADHLEIYGTAEALIESFKQFANQVSDKICIAEGLKLSGDSIGFSKENSVYAEDIQVQNGSYVFNLNFYNQRIENLKLKQLKVPRSAITILKSEQRNYYD